MLFAKSSRILKEEPRTLEGKHVLQKIMMMKINKYSKISINFKKE